MTSGIKTSITFTLAAGLILSMLLMTSCSQVREAAYRGATSAVSDRVEQEVYREVSSMIVGYSDMMLYQLAYTQAFMLGGFNVGLEDFEEGQGSTWTMEAGDVEQQTRYTVERALLKRDDDGSSWWYLKYQPEDQDAIEYEIRMNRNMEPMEMYLMSAEMDEPNYHEFDSSLHSSEYEDGYDQLEEDGFNTHMFHIEDWENYKQRTESLRIGSRTFNTTVLFYEGSEEEGDEGMEVTWWLSEDLPGELARYEMKDTNEGVTVKGEMTDLRDDYRPKFASF